jgi:hypothetical protein
MSSGGDASSVLVFFAFSTATTDGADASADATVVGKAVVRPDGLSPPQQHKSALRNIARVLFDLTLTKHFIQL